MNSAISRSVGSSAQNTSGARRGAGTFGEPVIDGTTRHTARKMKNCATTHDTAAIQKIASSTNVGTVDSRELDWSIIATEK